MSVPNILHQYASSVGLWLGSVTSALASMVHLSAARLLASRTVVASAYVEIHQHILRMTGSSVLAKYEKVRFSCENSERFLCNRKCLITNIWFTIECQIWFIAYFCTLIMLSFSHLYVMFRHKVCMATSFLSLIIWSPTSIYDWFLAFILILKLIYWKPSWFQWNLFPSKWVCDCNGWQIILLILLLSTDGFPLNTSIIFKAGKYHSLMKRVNCLWQHFI